MENEAFQSNDIDKIVNKARRKSVIRNIIISTFSLIVVGALFLFINGQVVSKAHLKAADTNRLLYEISHPNVQIGGGEVDYDIFSGSYTYNQFKIIENRIIPWGLELRSFNGIGHNNKSSAIAVYDEIRVGENEDELRRYNTTNGQRVMDFYHPWLDYLAVHYDLDLIQDAPSDAVMEVAISFDQPYTTNEIQEIFKLNNKITWFWVNEYKQNDKKHLEGLHSSGTSASKVYGFNVETLRGEGDIVIQDEKDFLVILEELKSTGNYDFMIDPLLESTKQNMNEGLIVGAVITGTKDELLKLKEEKHIRAISLGAVVRNY
ncbi:anti sigma factor C-terminal domain-containing protein [Sutcliffiella horikoshii]|uniref:anti sigma factor C-terminal domain-containing protein n=1 Tax=Sutcliffiella horikoshii TaxID=79883 RepID=UPI003CF7190E